MGFLSGEAVVVALVLIAAMGIGATLQRLSGMGVGLIGAPVAAIFLGPAEGVLLINALALVNAGILTWQTRAYIDTRRLLLLGPVMVVGSIPAALIVRHMSPDWLLIIVGVLIIVALGISLAVRHLPAVDGKLGAWLAGSIGGFMNTLAGVAGPAITVYAMAAKWEQRSYAATLQPLFLIAASLSILSKVLLGGMSVTSDIDAGYFLLGLGGMLVGIYVGTRLAGRVSRTSARAMAIAVAGLGGLSVAIRGLLGVLG